MEKKSVHRLVKCGVPQGSTLGPLLFIIYVNDLPNISKFRTTLFADDTCLTMSHISTLKLEQDINSEMTKVADWFSVNKLSLNYKKTELLVVSKRKQTQQINLHMVTSFSKKVKLSALW